MRMQFFYVILLFVFAACKSKVYTKPALLTNVDTISSEKFELLFQAEDKNWSATVSSFTQPIPVLTQFANGKIIVQNIMSKGVIEGPAQVYLSNGKHQFYYSFWLKNKNEASSIYIDYRSPKTVNPDSSLLQQRICFSIDSNRNIVAGNNTFFVEKDSLLQAKAGDYRAIKIQALSAYYVQPGSCTNITLKANYDAVKNCFDVTAGSLHDKYNNTIANGTLVTFIYKNGDKTSRMETTTLHGFAATSLPVDKDEHYELIAEINNSFSSPLKLESK